MGQAASSATPSPPTRPAPDGQQRRRSSLWRRSLASPPPVASRQDDDMDPSYSAASSFSSSPSSSRRPSRPRPHAARSSSIHRLSQLLRSSNGPAERPSRLQRARTSLSNFGARHSPFSRPAPVSRSQTGDFGYALPHVELNFDNFEYNLGLATADRAPRTPSARSSFRLPTSLSDRLAVFRSDPSPRNPAAASRHASSTRLESDPIIGPEPPSSWTSAAPPDSSSTSASAGRSTRARADDDMAARGGNEDNTALISRILSVAAATTAATLLDGDQEAIAEARSVGGDGTFSNFLQSLESGRLASALRQGGQSSANAPLNFFRMFRFGSTSGRDGRANGAERSAQSAGGSSDGRMVPVIIVGIRSVNQATANSAQDTAMPPFLDALSALPRTPFTGDSDSIDGILSPTPTHRFSHRRRASMGGLSTFPSAYDAQRHPATPDRIRSRSMASSRPPISLSPSLSRVSSANSISAARMPERPSSSRSNSNYSDRRESIIRTTTTTTTLETTREDAPLRPRPHRPRRLSESDYGRRGYSSRRNGIVEPDNVPSDNTRSWIIYVLGGSYPENHPIITTPSLYTDSPTYEDMMLLSALLGPAKPPVASEQDVADAPGLFKIETAGHTLVAVAVDGEETIQLTPEQRCLVCLCDFEADEDARRLIQCRHLFHKECIDQWLTKGRNSCPLCRGQGVDEKEKAPPAETPSTPLAADVPIPDAPPLV